MANAKRDGNNVPTILAVSNVDNTTPVTIWADPSTHELLVSGAGGTGGDGAIVDGVSASIKATVFDYTSSNPLAVRLTDTNGDYIAAGAGTQYTEDAVAAADPIGTALNLIRKDTLAALTSADGDNVAARGTDKGELYVKHADAIVLGAGTAGIGKLTANSGVTIGAVEIAAAQTLATVTTVSSLGTGTTGPQKAEDSAHSSTDAGMFVLAVSNEGNTARAADGDYIAIATDTEGNVRAVGNRDHDAVDAGETVKVGGFATNVNTTRVANNDRTHFIADLAGRQITNLGQVREMRGKQTTTISASTSETTIVTAAASTFKDLVALIISNTSASTNTRIDFRDTTAGTVLFSLQAPANQTVGFSLAGHSIPQTTVNTNWTAQCATSTTDIRILAIFENNT